jgi:DNA processing protein
MARGIDTAAHRAALDVTGNTVAVLGCGVDVVYPSENRKLADEIAAKGLLLSEFPMGTPGYPQNFPIRNRVVSGLSAGVLVIEGAQYSGSTITARLAVEQGRELFAVPGNITNRMSWGPNMLIKDGAKLVQEATDVLEELPAGERGKLHLERKAAESRQATLAPELDSPISRDVLRTLRADEPQAIDDMLESLPQHSASEILASLFELEVLGLTRQLPGGKYLKVW